MRARGMSERAIAMESGIPRATIRYWLHPPVGHQRASREGCFRCDESRWVLTSSYAYLLGLYLGDGYLALHPRDVWRLRIFQDARYSDLIDLCREVMGSISGTRVGVVQRPGCVEINSYWKHWLHLFPQHGRGRKHERGIALEPWQEEIVAACPKEFIRGLVHSDGCRSINRIWYDSPVEGSRQYAYPRYLFTNASDDIRGLFTVACDQLGVRLTTTNARTVAISRRDDVEFLDTFIGPKS